MVQPLTCSGIQDVTVESSMVGDGCLIQPGCTISNSVVGLRSKIYANTIIEDSLLMGSDYYERPEDCELAAHCLPMGIGANSCAPSVPRSFSSAICRLFVFLRARSVLGSPPSTGTNLSLIHISEPTRPY